MAPIIIQIKCLSKGSADQYTASSVKTYLKDRFRNNPPIPVFQKSQWSKLKEKLSGKYREQSLVCAVCCTSY